MASIDTSCTAKLKVTSRKRCGDHLQGLGLPVMQLILTVLSATKLPKKPLPSAEHIEFGSDVVGHSLAYTLSTTNSAPSVPLTTERWRSVTPENALLTSVPSTIPSRSMVTGLAFANEASRDHARVNKTFFM